MSFSSGLDINQVDFEAISNLRGDNASLLLSGGGRYLRLAGNYRGALSSTANIGLPAGGMATATESRFLTADRTFGGGGPTMALQGTYRPRFLNDVIVVGALQRRLSQPSADHGRVKVHQPLPGGCIGLASQAIQQGE